MDVQAVGYTGSQHIQAIADTCNNESSQPSDSNDVRHTCREGTARELGDRQHFGEAKALGGVQVGKQAVAPVQTVAGIATQRRHCDHPLRLVRLAPASTHSIHLTLPHIGCWPHTGHRPRSIQHMLLSHRHSFYTLLSVHDIMRTSQ